MLNPSSASSFSAGYLARRHARTTQVGRFGFIFGRVVSPGFYGVAPRSAILQTCRPPRREAAAPRRTTMFVMSGLAPIAAVMLQCHDRSKSARTGREQSQQTAQLFDHLVGAAEQGRWNGNTNGPCGFKIDDQFEPGWLHDRKIGWLFALENTAGIDADLAVAVHYTRSVADQAACHDEIS